MTSSSRLHTLPSHARVRFARPPSITALLAGVTVSLFVLLLLLLALSASPASAKVTTVGPTTVGLTPRVAGTVFDGAIGENEGGGFFEVKEPFTFANVPGNPVIHASNVYAIYWDPTFHYHDDWAHLIDGFLANVGNGSEGQEAANLFSAQRQYTDRSNQPAAGKLSLRGAYTDTGAYPTSGCTDPHPLKVYEPHGTKPLGCLTDAQVRAELQAFIGQHGLPTGMSTVYYVLTPPGLTVCLDAGGPGGHCSDFEASPLEEEEEVFTTASYKHSFCSYHGDVNPNAVETGDSQTIVYGMIPWTAGGLADGQLAKEDQKKAFQCQDGGFNPASSPIEAHEPKPVQQEPNQPQECPSSDGFCDLGLADLIINQVAIEEQNIVTNPLLNAWNDETGNEATDECRNFFAPATGSVTPNPGSGAGTLSNQSINGRRYYLNMAFNMAALELNYPGVPCVPGIALEPEFTAPNAANAGDILGFNGMESTITLDSNTTYASDGTPQPNYATYTWDFGDGTPVVSGYAPGAPVCTSPWLSPCAASVFHSYQYGGTYDVTLTVHDVGGFTASTIRTVTVSGPAAPSPSGPGGGSGGPGGGSSGGGSSSSSAGTTGGSAGGSGGSTGGGSTGGGSTGLPNPVASASVLSRSLRHVMKNGVIVAYSVNEQVAGHFEVLLSRTVAKRLKITGTAASGLPAGSPPSLVVAKALVVTTAGGRSKVTLFFSKRNAERLSRQRRVSFLLRLVVRNAAPRPATATLLSSFTLTR